VTSSYFFLLPEFTKKRKLILHQKMKQKKTNDRLKGRAVSAFGSKKFIAKGLSSEYF